jgi:proteasome lid subunit RPN8/RPN11
MDLKEEMLVHAREAYPNEACGLVVSRGGSKFRLIRALNLADKPMETFDLDPDAWLQVADDEEVIGIYHSHPFGTAEPSMADLSSCETTELPWHIVGLAGDTYQVVHPSGYEAPYADRPYVYGVHDCWSIIRDWYRRELSIELMDFARNGHWWERGQNRYVENIEVAGFVELRGEVPRPGDLMLLQMGARVTNHAAIWIGDGTILHHVFGRLSCTEPWAGTWSRFMTHHLRHSTKVDSNG